MKPFGMLLLASRPGENVDDFPGYLWGTDFPRGTDPCPCLICSQALKSSVFALVSSAAEVALELPVSLAKFAYLLAPADGGGGG